MTPNIKPDYGFHRFLLHHRRSVVARKGGAPLDPARPTKPTFSVVDEVGIGPLPADLTVGMHSVVERLPEGLTAQGWEMPVKKNKGRAREVLAMLNNERV